MNDGNKIPSQIIEFKYKSKGIDDWIEHTLYPENERGRYHRIHPRTQKEDPIVGVGRKSKCPHGTLLLAAPRQTANPVQEASKPIHGKILSKLPQILDPKIENADCTDRAPPHRMYPTSEKPFG